MTELMLVRHGETDWNVERRWQGYAEDQPLNHHGREQARELARELASEPLVAIYASDLRRASETATIVAEAHELQVRTMVELRELDVGNWSGLTGVELEERFPEQWARHRERWGSGWEGGETAEQLSARVLAAVGKIVQEQPSGLVLVVTHGGVVRALGAVAAGLSFLDYAAKTPVIANCSVHRIACEGGNLRPLD